ncbi:tRNA (N6-threonylcarbamoyladenosine(37)-N6)-methyltransferase TrmO [Methanolobus psychrotolerans]|uniref:tRNA (N6-threonylcarbamoyladenosine(37)-N6)-methyltransferase TrmO n=1 Tax=Methanolobus psychrotolerans TaxID=1874706 RepID=UPI000B91C86A|nr:tRNA (N6-threonylcarbamoyladenosine(37)-N6)-methyltransferase TrmO [Methanolobus psychrotolerans]
MCGKIEAETISRVGISIEPVGVIKNNLKVPPLIAGKEGLKLNGAYESAITEMSETYERISEIILADELDDLLDGIEDYSHIVVIYWGHQITEVARKLTKVHPAGREDNPLKGIYSTCSPARPNPILMTVVRLIKRDRNRLLVCGLDAIDNSPVLDIKPYVPDLFPKEDVLIPDWMETIIKGFLENRY